MEWGSDGSLVNFLQKSQKVVKICQKVKKIFERAPQQAFFLYMFS
jgi:hypothetical protein